MHRKFSSHSIVGALAFLLVSAAATAPTKAQLPTFASFAPSRGPAQRSSGDLAYDPVRKCTVLYGGRDINNVVTDETWEWDGIGWSQRLPPATPGPRENHALAYAPGFGVVLFGGNATSPSALGDMWRWDGITWTQCAFPVMPPATRGPAMAWHGGASPGLLLFGGLNAAGNATNETWLFDGATWSLLSTTGPSPRYHAGIAYADSLQRTYLIGGVGGNSELWVWNGTAWTGAVPLVLMHSIPWIGGPLIYQVQLDFPSMSWDSARNELVVVPSGFMSGAFYVFHGQPSAYVPTQVQWSTEVNPYNALAPGSGATDLVCYDSHRHCTIFVGGQSIVFPQRKLAECASAGGGWVIRSGSYGPAVMPSSRSYAKMAHRPSSARSMLFGGWNGTTSLADTWSFDGAAWTNHGTSQLAAGRCGHAMSQYQGGIVMFGGGAFGGVSGTTYFNDTREWDGADWQLVPLTGASPSPRMNHDMVWEAQRNRLVMFGGTNGGALGDTWVQTGTGASRTWTRLTTIGQPPARHSHRLAYDALRGRVVMFGGCDANGQPLADTWELSGNRWGMRSPAVAPIACWNHSMHYDPLRQAVVLSGGYANGVFLNDVWQYDGNTWLQLSPATTVPSAREGAASTYDPGLQRILLTGGYNWTAGFLDDTWFYHAL